MTDRIAGIGSTPVAAGPDNPEPGSTSTGAPPPLPVPSENPTSAGTRRLVEAFQSNVERKLKWYGEKAGSEAACLLLPCEQALWSARAVMPNDGMGRHMLDHFLSGSAAPVAVDLDPVIARNPRLHELLSSRIEFDLAEQHAAGTDVELASGAVWISQTDYGETSAGRDAKYGLGGTFFEYEVVGSSANGGLEASIHVADHYAWTPSDTSRSTQCLHECGAELVAEGRATEFFQYGEGTLSVADPRSNPTTLPLDYPPEDPQ